MQTIRKNRKVVVNHLETVQTAFEELQKFWQQIGSKISEMSYEETSIYLNSIATKTNEYVTLVQNTRETVDLWECIELDSESASLLLPTSNLFWLLCCGVVDLCIILAWQSWKPHGRKIKVN